MFQERIRDRGQHRRRRRWQSRWRAVRGTGGIRILAAAAGGLAVVAGVAPSTWWWAPILGFAMLALAVAGRGWKAAAGLGLVFGATMFFPLLSWTNVYVGDVPWVALAGAESVLVAPAVAVMGPASRRLPAWPLWGAAAWVGGEALRGVFPFGGFPWGTVAFTQADGPLLPIAAVLGGAGLSLAVALAGLALGDLLRRGWVHRHRAASYLARSLPVPAVLVAADLLAGPASLPAEVSARGAPTKPIAVVQGNVPQPGLDFNARREAVLKMHAAETRRLARAVAAGDVPQPVAVLWPENSSDIDPYRNPDAARIISAATRQMGVPILVGAVVQAGAVGQHARGSGSTIGHVYNEGIVWDPVTGPGQTYIKRHPVPFGEYVPYRSFFRLFTSKVDLVTADFLPGHRPGNLDVGGVAVGDVICFEIVEDDLVRDVVDGGATVIVVQTNNATFGYTDETYQQQAMSRVRAVEFGREVLISATSGVSTVIRPDGSVESSVPLFTAGYLVPQVPMLSAITPGTVLGAPVRWAATAITPLLLAGEMLFRRRRRTRRAVMVTMERTTTGD